MRLINSKSIHLFNEKYIKYNGTHLLPLFPPMLKNFAIVLDQSKFNEDFWFYFFPYFPRSVHCTCTVHSQSAYTCHEKCFVTIFIFWIFLYKHCKYIYIYIMHINVVHCVVHSSTNSSTVDSAVYNVHVYVTV